MAKKEKTFDLSADPIRLQELANCRFKSTLEAETFFKGMVVTGIAMWMKEDRTEEEETILTDTLAALMYVLI